MSAAEVRLALAQMALRFDNVEGAERWFESVLSDNDLRALAEAGLGRVAGYRGDIQAANARFESAIRLMAWDFTIWMDYAQYWAQRVANSYDPKERVRHASRLIDALENALTISEATPELNSLMGFAYLAKGNDPHEAIDYLEAAAAEAPHDQASRLLLANCYLRLGQREQAATQLLAAVALEPGSADLHNNLANVLMAREDYPAAEELLIRAVGASERVMGEDSLDVAVGLNNLASLYSRRDRQDRAEPLLELFGAGFGEAAGDHGLLVDGTVRRGDHLVEQAEAIAHAAIRTFGQ